MKTSEEQQKAMKRKLDGIKEAIAELYPALTFCRNDTDEHESLADKAQREAARDYLESQMSRLVRAERETEAWLNTYFHATHGPDPIIALLASDANPGPAPEGN